MIRPTTLDEMRNILNTIHPSTYRYYDELPLPLQKEVIREWPHLLRNFIDPHRELIKIALSDPHAYSYIQEYLDGIIEFDEELQLLAVNHDPPFSSVDYVSPLKLISNPTEKVILLAVGINGHDLYYVNNPSYAACMIAVRETGYAISCVPKPWSYELRMAAAQHYGISEIPDPTYEEQCAAMDASTQAIRDIKNPTEEIQLRAVMENSGNIKLITNPCIQAILAAYPLTIENDLL